MLRIYCVLLIMLVGMLRTASAQQVTEMNLAASLHAAIAAVCPSIAGVSIGFPYDKTTWRVAFDPNKPQPTTQQLAAMKAVIDNFALPAPPAVTAPLVGPVAPPMSYQYDPAKPVTLQRQGN